MHAIGEFMEGLVQGFRPLRAALPLLWRGCVLLGLGVVVGLVAAALGADRLGGGLIVMSACVGGIHFLAAWIQLIRAAASYCNRNEGAS